jgi:hypothetical protein
MAVSADADVSPVSNAKAFRMKSIVDVDTADNITRVESEVVEALRARGTEWFATQHYSPDDHLVPAIRRVSAGIEARIMIDKELPAGTISVDLYVTHMIVSETGLKLMWTALNAEDTDADPGVDHVEAKRKSDKLAKKIRASKQRVTQIIQDMEHANLDDQADWLLQHDLM